LVYFWNGSSGKFTAKGVILPAFLELSNKLKEVFTYAPNAEQALRPIWDIVAVAKLLGTPFGTQTKAGKQYLPAVAQRQLAEYLTGVKAKGG
jgi:hypothetical protein